MQLEDYFEISNPAVIRLKGHRVNIEHVLYKYVEEKKDPEAILKELPTLTLEKVYATILYYLQHKEEMDRYLEEDRLGWEQWNKEHAADYEAVRARLQKRVESRPASVGQR